MILKVIKLRKILSRERMVYKTFFFFIFFFFKKKESEREDKSMIYFVNFNSKF